MQCFTGSVILFFDMNCYLPASPPVAAEIPKNPVLGRTTFSERRHTSKSRSLLLIPLWKRTFGKKENKKPCINVKLGHPYRENVFVVLDLCPDWKRLVPKVPETPGQLLGAAVGLVVVVLIAVVYHGHHVGVVVLVVVVKRVEEETQAVPPVVAAENLEKVKYRFRKFQ